MPTAYRLSATESGKGLLKGLTTGMEAMKLLAFTLAS